jgi:DNA-binding SARP family transcriptional activator
VPLSFQVLGGFSVRRGGWRAGERDWGRPAAARLVRYLLAQHGAPVPEDAILEALWPELTPNGARRSLRVAASRARRVLDFPGAERQVLEVHDGAYALSLDERDSVDAEEFEAAARAALDEPGAQRRPLLERARSLWTGEPLPQDRYADWAVSWREHLTDLHVGVLDALAGLYSGAGEQPAAISVAGELVSLDPLHEGAHRSLMVAYARAGRPGHALRQYLECRRALVEGLGIEPAAETSRLQALILAGEPV